MKAAVAGVGPLARVTLALALLGGTVWRLSDVGSAFLFGDELHTLRDMHGGLTHVMTHFSATGSGMALPLLQLGLIELFGVSHWSIRAPAYLAGLALLYLCFPLARRTLGDEAAAVISVLLVAVNPLLIFYSHFARAYSLVALLCLVMLYALDRVVEGESCRGARLVWLALVTALVPWAHVAALGFVLPVHAGAIAALWMRGGARRRDAARVAAGLGLGGLLCLALHLPAWASLRRFVTAKTSAEYYGDFDLSDVAALLAGNPGLAWPAVSLAGAAAAAMLTRRGARSLPLVLGCAGPGLVIALVRPYGDAYAYARYVMPAVVPGCMLIGWGVSAAFSAAGLPEALRRTAPIVTGALLAAIVFMAGATGPRAVSAGPHANTYLDLLPLPAFDEPWPGMPSFYRELAARGNERREREPGVPLRVIESPALTTRSRHLYRAYHLAMGPGVETVLAPFPGELPCLPQGPYVSLRRPSWRESADADYLIVHTDIAGELARYWRFVYEHLVPTRTGMGMDALLQRHRRYGGCLGPPPPGMLARLTVELGPPIHRDEEIVVWRLR